MPPDELLRAAQGILELGRRLIPDGEERVTAAHVRDILPGAR
jgi:hypothetical protein